MKKLLMVPALCLLSMVCAGAHADPIAITNASPAWQQVGTGATWVLPSVIPGCGNENEPSCEPTGVFYGNVAWAGNPSYISFTESDGSLSDVITFDSAGPGGVFRVQFFSDPNADCCTVPAGYSLYANYNEDSVTGATSGAVPICCELTGVSVNLGSDGESPFDPFGYGADTSDGIQFTGNVIAVPAPEPGALALLGVGLAGLGLMGRRKAA